MIQIENLQKIYPNGFEALHDIDLAIEEGALVCLLGPSGCGKSTMLNLIAGLLDPTTGDIRFAGESVVNRHPKDRHIGMVFQNYSLYPHMTVLENVTFPLRVGDNKVAKIEADKIAKQFLTLTDIAELSDKKPASLSGGQQQRVAIARALVQQPKILLLDEPLSNLDARLRLRIREEIRRLVKRIGVTTVFVTHDQEEALSISDKIALLSDGVIQQYDDPQALYRDPNNLFVAKFIGNPIINTFQLSLHDGFLVGDNWQLHIDDLQSERLRARLIDGTYTLAIRPEHFSIDPSGTVHSRLEMIEMIGRYAILHFDFLGQSCRAVVDSRHSLTADTTLQLAIDYQSIYLFDQRGERVY